MKFYLMVVVAVLAISYTKATSPTTPPDILPAKVLCVRESNVTEDQLEKSIQGDYGDEEKYAKYTVCMFRKQGFFDEHDQFVPSALKAIIPPSFPDYDEQMTNIDRCATKTGETPEIKALEIYKCFITKFHEKMFGK